MGDTRVIMEGDSLSTIEEEEEEERSAATRARRAVDGSGRKSREDLSTCAVRVAVRVRPLIQKELVEGCDECLHVISSRNEIEFGRNRRFTFDRVLPPACTQEEVYDICGVDSLVDGCFSGYNSTIFAYGQTSSGKTFTMGSSCAAHAKVSPEEEGIIPRVVKKIFDTVAEKKADREVLIRVSFLEIHRENFQGSFVPHQSILSCATTAKGRSISLASVKLSLLHQRRQRNN